MRYLIMITGLLLMLSCETLTPKPQESYENPSRCIDDGESIQCETTMYCQGSYSRQPWNNDKECVDSTIAVR
jgi:hypothetical protein